MPFHTVLRSLLASAAFLAFSSSGFTAEPDSILAPRDVFLLSPVRMPSAGGQFKVVILDTVELLNRSRWRDDKDPLPLTPKAALDLAVASIPSNIRKQTEKGLSSIALKPFDKATLPGVWYYDIEFLPFNQTRSGYDDSLRYIAIILMDGTTIVPKAMGVEDFPKDLWCTYTRNKGTDVWQRIICK